MMCLGSLKQNIRRLIIVNAAFLHLQANQESCSLPLFRDLHKNDADCNRSYPIKHKTLSAEGILPSDFPPRRFEDDDRRGGIAPLLLAVVGRLSSPPPAVGTFRCCRFDRRCPAADDDAEFIALSITSASVF